MAEHAIILEGTKQEIDKLGSADIVVDIPSYNNADTIGHVVRTVHDGLAKYFPSHKSVIVNSDGGSTDGTPERVLDATDKDSPVLQVAYPVYPVHKLSTPYDGIPGKGSAFRTVFSAAQRLGAKVCVAVDSDLRSITPEWIDLLARPVIEQEIDFVAPYYLRHKYDGTITNSIVYPMTRALYGKRIRQPIGGEFAFSRRLIDYYLQQDVWTTDVARFGIDIWVTTQAICGGFKLCQTFLGAKVHNPKDPASDLSAMLAQVLGSLFAEMERNVEVWHKTRGSEPVPLLGRRFEIGTEPVRVDVKRMIESMRLGFKDLQEVWSLILPPAVLADLKRLGQRSDDEFRFPDEVWVPIVYDFALGYHVRAMSRDHLLWALTPLYLGWVASFILEMREAEPHEVEDRLEHLSGVYETQKRYLISRWRWPDRFNP